MNQNEAMDVLRKHLVKQGANEEDIKISSCEVNPGHSMGPQYYAYTNMGQYRILESGYVMRAMTSTYATELVKDHLYQSEGIKPEEVEIKSSEPNPGHSSGSHHVVTISSPRWEKFRVYPGGDVVKYN